MRTALLLSLSSLLMSTAIVVVVPAKVPLSKRVLFVVDVSGSMAGLKFDRASLAVLEIAGQPVDEMEIGLIAFDNVPSRWPGVPERGVDGRPGTPKGWAALPSKQAVDGASSWLRKINPTGGTRAIPAMEAALAEERDQLSIVLVTDGQFYQETSANILTAVAKAQEKRVDKGLGRAVLLVYGVGDTHSILEELGKRGHGGFYRKPNVPDVPDPILLMPQAVPTRR